MVSVAVLIFAAALLEVAGARFCEQMVGHIRLSETYMSEGGRFDEFLFNQCCANPADACGGFLQQYRNLTD